jgi:hypothetical protein
VLSVSSYNLFCLVYADSKKLLDLSMKYTSGADAPAYKHVQVIDRTFGISKEQISHIIVLTNYIEAAHQSLCPFIVNDRLRITVNLNSEFSLSFVRAADKKQRARMLQVDRAAATTHCVCLGGV